MGLVVAITNLIITLLVTCTQTTTPHPIQLQAGESPRSTLPVRSNEAILMGAARVDVHFARTVAAAAASCAVADITAPRGPDVWRNLS